MSEQFLKRAYEGKRCVVFGGLGMLGSYLVERLESLGADENWIVVHDIERDFKDDIVTYPEGVHDTVMGCKPHYVFNLAAKVTGITFNEHHHYTMAAENALLSLNPLRACADLDVRYVYTSTACVYPPNAPIPTEEHHAQANTPEFTNRGYGWAKLFGEWCHEWAAQENPKFRPLILRPSNMYSPREHFDDPDAHVIPRVIYRLLSGEDPMVIRGTGNVTRSFLHARDAAEGMLLAAATDAQGPLNLSAASETEVSIRDLVAVLCELTGRFPEIRWDSTANEGYQRRLSSTRLFDAELEKAGVKWSPPTSLRDGLKETVEACLDTHFKSGSVQLVQG